MSDEPNLTQAADVAGRALAIDSQFGAAHVSLGMVESSRGDLNAAIGYFERAIGFGESTANVMIWLANALSRKGEYKRAIELFDRASRLDPLNWLTHFSHGDTRYMQGSVVEAYELYQRTWEVEPANPAGPGLMGAVAGVGLGDVADSVQRFRHALELDASDAELVALLALAYSAIGDGDSAIDMATRAIDIASSAGFVVHVKVRQLIDSGQHDSALQLADRTLQDFDALHRRGSKVNLEADIVGIHMMRGEFAEAEEFLLTQYPDLLSMTEAKPAQSLEDLSPAGGNVIVVQMLANLYHLTGKSDVADVLVGHLAIVSPDNVHLVYEHAVQLYDGPRQELRPDDHWILAVAGLGRDELEITLDHLEAAAKGFLLDWRLHFIDHPALWSLRDHPRYQGIIEGIEAKMAEQRQSLIAGTPDRQ